MNANRQPWAIVKANRPIEDVVKAVWLTISDRHPTRHDKFEWQKPASSSEFDSYTGADSATLGQLEHGLFVDEYSITRETWSALGLTFAADGGALPSKIGTEPRLRLEAADEECDSWPVDYFDFFMQLAQVQIPDLEWADGSLPVFHIGGSDLCYN
jgi:hypothetical protein